MECEEEYVMDEDYHYECWRDDAGIQLDEHCQEIIDVFLNDKGGYYEGKDNRLFEHIVGTIGSLLGKQVTIKPLCKSFKRVVVEVK